MDIADGTISPATVSQTIIAQTYDIDFAGYMSNIAYLRWCEDLRMALLATRLPLRDALKRGMFPVVAETIIRYRSPIKLHDEIVCSSSLTAIEGKFFTLQTTFERDGAEPAVCAQKLCFVNADNGRSIPLPPEFAL